MNPIQFLVMATETKVSPILNRLLLDDNLQWAVLYFQFSILLLGTFAIQNVWYSVLNTCKYLDTYFLPRLPHRYTPIFTPPYRPSPLPCRRIALECKTTINSAWWLHLTPLYLSPDVSSCSLFTNVMVLSSLQGSHLSPSLIAAYYLHVSIILDSISVMNRWSALFE